MPSKVFEEMIEFQNSISRFSFGYWFLETEKCLELCPKKVRKSKMRKYENIGNF